jgi:hypothetical protein
MMELDLLYEGHLPSESWNGDKAEAKVPYKQCIRSCFHEQLVAWMELVKWTNRIGLEHHPKGRWSKQSLIPVTPQSMMQRPPIAPYLELGDQKYIPVVTAGHGLICDLEITILSRRSSTKRDTDNRVKVLHDALSILHGPEEVKGCPVAHDPCFCLLEDDGALIGEESTVTRELLKPLPMRSEEVVVWGDFEETSKVLRSSSASIVGAFWRGWPMRRFSADIDLTHCQHAPQSISETFHSAIRVVGWHVRRRVRVFFVRLISHDCSTPSSDIRRPTRWPIRRPSAFRLSTCS